MRQSNPGVHNENVRVARFPEGFLQGLPIRYIRNARLRAD
jgi:hypothetical protein